MAPPASADRPLAVVSRADASETSAIEAFAMHGSTAGDADRSAVAESTLRSNAAPVFITAEDLRAQELALKYPGFDIGSNVWVPADARADDPYLLGHVQSIGPHQQLTLSLADGSVVERKLTDVMLAGKPTRQAPNNVVHLPHLNQAAVLKCIEKRWRRKLPYTWAGSILLSVNPFEALPALTSEVERRHHATGETLSAPPHPYAVAEAAVRGAMRRKELGITPQVIIVTGESGSGKTELTKTLLAYLTRRVPAGATELSATGTHLADAMAAGAVVLEAFGHAKTTRNGNASRFGKCVSLEYDGGGAVTRATVRTYLLEQHRVTSIVDPERSYHVFYSLLATGPPATGRAAGAASIASLPPPCSASPSSTPPGSGGCGGAVGGAHGSLTQCMVVCRCARTEQRRRWLVICTRRRLGTPTASAAEMTAAYGCGAEKNVSRAP